MFGDVVLDLPKKKFEHIFDVFDGVKTKEKVKFDYGSSRLLCREQEENVHSWSMRFRVVIEQSLMIERGYPIIEYPCIRLVGHRSDLKGPSLGEGNGG
jgi:hypothetical protein